MALPLRSCFSTVPSVIADAGLPSGRTSATYRSPNNVFGRSRAVAFDGIISAMSGSMANSEVTTPSAVVAERTSPTIMPRTFTSALRGSALPTLSVSSDTVTTSSNVLLYEVTLHPTNMTMSRTRAIPRSRFWTGEGEPVMRPWRRQQQPCREP